MTNRQQTQLTERRAKTNLRLRLLQWLSIVAWCCFIIALMLFHYARPELNYGILRYANITVRETWLTDYKFYFEAMLVVCCVLSLASVLVNRRIMRRKHDRFYYNVVLLAALCIVALIALMVG